MKITMPIKYAITRQKLSNEDIRDIAEQLLQQWSGEASIDVPVYEWRDPMVSDCTPTAEGMGRMRFEFKKMLREPGSVPYLTVWVDGRLVTSRVISRYAARKS